jgi:Flp pilus assembly pilin Flp
MWWWDGSQWQPAISPDGRWRWDGRGWVPAPPAAAPARGGRAGMAIIVTILAFGGILLFVSLITIIVLYTLGTQISNVFSNVAAALGS